MDEFNLRVGFFDPNQSQVKVHQIGTYTKKKIDKTKKDILKTKMSHQRFLHFGV